MIEWWGWRDDMADVYNKAHLVCLPTYYKEGVPKTLIESAASGLPIVSTDVPGCREIVQHGKNGLLVPPRDSVALSEALEKLITSPNLRQVMGRRGREIAVNQFSQTKVVNETLKVVYQAVVSEHA